MTGQACSCGQPMHDGTYLCPTCVRTLDVALMQVAAHHVDLETLRTRRTRYGTGGGKGSVGKTHAIGVDLRFVTPSNATRDDGWQVPGREGQGSVLDDDVRNTLTGWARVCLEHWTWLSAPADTVPAVCAFLAGMATAVAGQPWADELLRDSIRLEKQLARLVDRPADRRYLGGCTAEHDGVACEGAVYAKDGDVRGTCDRCGDGYDIAASRDALEAALDSRLCTAAEIARLATYLGMPASRDQVRKRINQWHKRGRITAAGHTPEGDPTFRYDAVRGMLYADFGVEAS